MQRKTFGSVWQTNSALPAKLRTHYYRYLQSERDSRFQSEPQIATIGLPIYKAPSAGDYFEVARQCRLTFECKFRPLYEFVLEEAAAVFGLEAVLSPSLAPPGFHVITCGPDMPFFGGHWHSDVFPAWAHVQPLVTITLLLGPESPQCGTDIRLESPAAIPHVPGRATFFLSGLQHKIGAVQDPGHLTQRVTLQAHAAVVRNQVHLFW